jgi:hypothetical protein
VLNSSIRWNLPKISSTPAKDLSNIPQPIDLGSRVRTSTRTRAPSLNRQLMRSNPQTNPPKHRVGPNLNASRTSNNSPET